MNKLFLSKSAAVLFLSRQRGASLLEGIAYLGIAALVILGAVSLLTGAFTSAQSNRAAEEIISLRTAARKLYMGQVGSYPGSMNAPLNAVNAIPGTLNIGTGAALTNAWGGTVTVAGNAAGTAFTITYTEVPADACITLLAGSSGWTSVQVGTATAKQGVITPAQATTDCAGARNTIVWTAS